MQAQRGLTLQSKKIPKNKKQKHVPFLNPDHNPTGKMLKFE
jgi:hypothetical protein